MSETPKGWHSHPNGWGLVQDTASVADSAYVGPDALVCGGAEVSGDAMVSGHARVSGSAMVYGGEWKESPPQMEIGRWYGHMREAQTVAIGCQTCDLGEDLRAWVQDLGVEYNATDQEIATALAFVDLCKAMKGTKE